MRHRVVLLLPLVVVVACSVGGPTPQPATPPSPSASPVAPPSAPLAAPPASSSAAAASSAPPAAASGAASAGSATAASQPPDGPASCPSGMKLVDGDYCTEVEHKCLKEWYDKSNKKTICEAFEPTAKCVGKRLKRRFCIDDYAWPNVRGERPEVMNNFFQAQVKCASVGKRMCTESEWTLACEGPDMKPFPYGFVRDAAKCNGDHLWDDPDMKKVAKRDPKELARLWKGVPNGAQPECVSDYGVADLAGNTDDVVSNESWHRGGMYGKFESVHTGGPWYKGTRNQCRPKIYTHDEGFYYYFLSFRCCGEPDGAETDPRTPHQRATKQPFRRVEQLARFSVDDVRTKLAEKARGKCECRPNDILCKTICGTLLGPNVHDADLAAPRVKGN
jgi:formylglycine-generating enzyme